MSSGNEIRNRVHFTHSGNIDAGWQPSEDILGDNLLYLSVFSHVLHYYLWLKIGGNWYLHLLHCTSSDTFVASLSSANHSLNATRMAQSSSSSRIVPYPCIHQIKSNENAYFMISFFININIWWFCRSYFFFQSFQRLKISACPQGLAPGLSLSIILTLLSMCGDILGNCTCWQQP
jgi:hypothetical protein